MAESALRDAATLILLRGTEAGRQVLLGRRAAGHRFMPHLLVFPGGAVDGEDFTAPLAAPLRPEVNARLQRSSDAALARALAHAAARELEEETGLSLGAPPRLDVLDYLCRAETPPGLPIRFNARFFMADADHAGGILRDSRELEDLTWHDLGAPWPDDLSTPTRAVLALLRTRAGRPPAPHEAVPVLRLRRWVRE